MLSNSPLSKVSFHYLLTDIGAKFQNFHNTNPNYKSTKTNFISMNTICIIINNINTICLYKLLFILLHVFEYNFLFSSHFFLCLIISSVLVHNFLSVFDIVTDCTFVLALKGRISTFYVSLRKEFFACHAICGARWSPTWRRLSQIIQSLKHFSCALINL